MALLLLLVPADLDGLLQTLLDQFDIRLGRSDCALRLLLKRVQHEHAVGESNGLHGPKRVAPVVGDHLQHSRAQPLQRLGRYVLLPALRQVDRVAHLVLHAGRERLQLPERITEPDDRFQRRHRHLLNYATFGMAVPWVFKDGIRNWLGWACGPRNAMSIAAGTIAATRAARSNRASGAVEAEQLFDPERA